MKSLTLPAPLTARLDSVWLAIAAILAVVALVDPPQVPESLAFVGWQVLAIAPFFFASVAITAYATATGADNLIAKAFQGRPAVMVVAAALIGALSPFCSCGVIPIIAALLTMGVPLAPVLAFCLASPVMDPAMFILTAGTLGTDFAVAKTLAAIGVGLIGGFGTLAATRLGLGENVLREGVGNGGCGGAKVRAPKPVVWAFWQEPARIEKARSTFFKTTMFLGKMLVLAFLLESLMVAYMPAGLIASSVGGEGAGTILLAALLGIPAYLNGAAALPLVGELMRQGMSEGAAMAFLVGGGVTSLPAAIAVWSLVRPKVFAAYVGFALLGATLSGLAYQVWVG